MLRAVIPIFEEVEKQRCLALLGFVSLLWCTEALPLYVTSMLVPVLVVVLGVLVDRTQEPPHRLTAQEAAPRIFHTMFSQVLRDIFRGGGSNQVFCAHGNTCTFLGHGGGWGRWGGGGACHVGYLCRRPPPEYPTPCFPRYAPGDWV